MTINITTLAKCSIFERTNYLLQRTLAIVGLLVAPCVGAEVAVGPRKDTVVRKPQFGDVIAVEQQPWEATAGRRMDG